MGYVPIADLGNYDTWCTIFDGNYDKVYEEKVWSGISSQVARDTFVMTATLSGPPPYTLVFTKDSQEFLKYSISGSVPCNHYSRTRASAYTSIGQSTGVSVITTVEPALEDTATIKWSSEFGGGDASTVVIGKDILNGDIVKEIPIDYGNGTSSGSTSIVGEVNWKPESDTPIGVYQVGVRYNDGHIKYDGYDKITVAPTVYDVYSYGNAPSSNMPFFPESDQQNKTLIHYKLSHDCGSATITVGGKTLYGTGNKDDNEVEWDGIDDADEVSDLGVQPVVVQPSTYTSLSHLSFSGVNTFVGNNQAASFAPEDGQQLTLKYKLSEPIKRVRSPRLNGYVTAIVCDAVFGNIVRHLVDNSQVSIDDDPTDTIQGEEHSITWDGKDDQNHYVCAGDYKIIYYAKDDAGVGCASPMQTTNVRVLMGDPGTILTLTTEGSGAQTQVNGYTNSQKLVSCDEQFGMQTIHHDLTPDEVGSFSFTLDSTPGKHTITASTARDGYSPANETLEALVTDLSRDTTSNTTSATSASATHSLSSQAAGLFDEECRFHPDQGEALSIDFNSALADDPVDITVTDPFTLSTCIDIDHPVMASEFLSGQVYPSLVKKIKEKFPVVAGRNSVPWDGKGDNGNPLAAGLYIISVSRSNDDGLGDAGFEFVAVVDRTDHAPGIIGINSHVQGGKRLVTWATSVPTIGAVLYAKSEVPVGKAISQTLGCNHSVELTNLEPNTTYNFWVAVNDSSGHTALSDKSTFTTGAEETFTDLVVLPVSNNVVDISWSTASTCFGRVYYAKVNPSGAIQWQPTLEEAVASQQHLLHLTNLATNSEYVFRVASTPISGAANSAISGYAGFMTKYSLPSVTITDPSMGTTISGTVNVTVEASDAIKRFPGNGIRSVSLWLDTTPLDINPVHAECSNTYIFTLDASKFESGKHFLLAKAVDDFCNENSYRTDVTITDDSQYISTQSATAMSGSSDEMNDHKIYFATYTARMDFKPPIKDPKKITVSLIRGGRNAGGIVIDEDTAHGRILAYDAYYFPKHTPQLNKDRYKGLPIQYNVYHLGPTKPPSDSRALVLSAQAQELVEKLFFCSDVLTFAGHGEGSDDRLWTAGLVVGYNTYGKFYYLGSVVPDRNAEPFTVRSQDVQDWGLSVQQLTPIKDRARYQIPHLLYCNLYACYQRRRTNDGGYWFKTGKCVDELAPRAVNADRHWDYYGSVDIWFTMLPDATKGYPFNVPENKRHPFLQNPGWYDQPEPL